MITTALAVVVAAERERVWRALTEPAEIVRWDETRTALGDRDRSYPKTGECVRWRSKLGAVALVLTETPKEIEPPARLALTNVKRRRPSPPTLDHREQPDPAPIDS